MTSLVFGVVGAVIGSFFGQPQLGFLIGSLIGSLVDPPKQTGPRLNDLKLQSATYGKMIPFFWGRGPLAGNIIHQTDLEEHKQKSSGKGGPVITTFTYSATWAVAIGAARVFGEDVIIDLLSIKADGRLIWDNTDGTNCPCTVYKGSEDQLPDPTLEAIHGVGNVPAYRGQAYFVFADYDLTDFGNRIPSLEFEVFTNGGDYPWQVSVGSPWNELNYGVSGFEYVNGEIIVTSQHAAAPQYAKWAKYDIDLNEIAAPVYTAGVDGMDTSAINNNNWIGTTPATTDIYWEVYDDTTGLSQQSTLISPDIYSHTPFGNLSVVIDDAWFGVETGVGPVCLIHKWTNGGGYVVSATPGAFNANALDLGTSDTGHLYAVKTVSGASEMWKYDSDLNLVHHWDAADLAGTRMTNGVRRNFVVYKDQVCFNFVIGTTPYIALVDIDPLSYLATDSVQPLLLQGAEGRLASLGGGLVMNSNNGVFSLDPPPAAVLLSKVVSDLADMSPITSYDATDLYDEVRWFIVGGQMIIRNALQTLRAIYFFDAVERGASAVFVRRDAFGESPARTIYTIPDEDLDARSYGEGPGPLLRTIRKKEQDLPRSVAMNFINVDTGYEIGSASTPRQVTLSQQDVTFDAPVGLTADEALQKCLALLLSEWVEREGFEFSTTRKWAKLQPCDLVYVRGRVIRILKVTESPNGVLKFSGVLAAPSLYTSSIASLYYQIAPGAPADGYIPPESPGAKVDTQMVLLDLPLIGDTDYPNGFYVAVGPAAAGSWTGASVFKSSDGGSTYAEVGSSVNADIIGTVALAIGNFLGGNIFDETNIIRVVVSSGSTLSSVSELAVLNGANECAIGTPGTGWEVLQYKTATLVGTDTYDLSGLLRGRRGTEWMMSRHAVSETFVALPTTININGAFSELGLTRKYKAVSFGGTLASATAQDFTNMGVALKPYSPVEVQGYRDGSGTIYLRCVRRTRIGGAWLDNVDVPLSEATEFYKFNIYSDSGYGTLLNQYLYAIDEYPYGSAQSFSDFGSPSPATLYFGVQQLGSYGYGYEGRGSV